LIWTPKNILASITHNTIPDYYISAHGQSLRTSFTLKQRKIAFMARYGDVCYTGVTPGYFATETTACEDIGKNASFNQRIIHIHNTTGERPAVYKRGRCVADILLTREDVIFQTGVFELPYTSISSPVIQIPKSIRLSTLLEEISDDSSVIVSACRSMRVPNRRIEAAEKLFNSMTTRSGCQLKPRNTHNLNLTFNRVLEKLHSITVDCFTNTMLEKHDHPSNTSSIPEIAFRNIDGSDQWLIFMRYKNDVIFIMGKVALNFTYRGNSELLYAYLNELRSIGLTIQNEQQKRSYAVIIEFENGKGVTLRGVFQKRNTEFETSLSLRKNRIDYRTRYIRRQCLSDSSSRKRSLSPRANRRRRRN